MGSDWFMVSHKYELVGGSIKKWEWDPDVVFPKWFGFPFPTSNYNSWNEQYKEPTMFKFRPSPPMKPRKKQKNLVHESCVFFFSFQHVLWKFVIMTKEIICGHLSKSYNFPSFSWIVLSYLLLMSFCCSMEINKDHPFFSFSSQEYDK